MNFLYVKAGILVVIISAFSMFNLFAQADEDPVVHVDTTISIFDYPEALKCTLEFDIKKFRRQKEKEKKHPATFTYIDYSGEHIKRMIEIEPRGVSRREICAFPPIRMKLKDAGFDDPYLTEVNNQKLVVNCKSNDRFNELLMCEYLCYKFYNLLTEKSYRVKLMEMTYVDTKAKRKTETRPAFLIEQTKFMAGRNDCTEIENISLGMAQIQKENMALFSLFQYMIGNVDWSMNAYHNVKVLLGQENVLQLLYLIPYDFDYSGVVNAPYAINSLDESKRSITERMFVGLCFTKEEYSKAIPAFFDKEKAFYDLVEQNAYLGKEKKEEVVGYLRGFFNEIREPDFYETRVLPFCKSR